MNFKERTLNAVIKKKKMNSSKPIIIFRIFKNYPHIFSNKITKFGMSAFRRHFIFMSLTKMGGKDRAMSGKEIALYSVLGVWGKACRMGS